MPIVTFLNQKGGVGKTSTCHHLAGTLAAMGLRVLLVDNDPQCSLTQGLLGPAATEELDPISTIAAVYGGGLGAPGILIAPTAVTGVDLLAGSWKLYDVNDSRPEDAPDRMQRCLDDYLNFRAPRHDFVLIDCPPDLRLCAWAALVASHAVVVPVQAEEYGIQGLKPVLDFAARVGSRANDGLAVAGLLVTMFDGRAARPQYHLERLRADMGDLVFSAVVPRCVEFIDAVASRRPASHHKPRGKAARSMQAVAAELMGRVGFAMPSGAGEGVALG